MTALAPNTETTMRIRLFYKGLGIVFALSLFALPMLRAAEPKPVLTVSTTNPENLYRIAERIATMAGALDDFNDRTQPYKELKGIVRHLPILFCLHDVDGKFEPFFFLPISNFAAVEIPGFELLQEQAVEKGNGKYRVNNSPFILTQTGDYLIVSMESSEIPIPDDPTPLIQGLEEYSLAIRFEVENITAETIRQWLALLRSALRMEDQTFAFDCIDEYVGPVCEAFRSMTFGVTMNPRTADTNLRMTFVAKPGSSAEKNFALQQDTQTVFSGFLGDANTALSLSFTGAAPKKLPLIDDLFKFVTENTEDDAVVESVREIIHTVFSHDKIDFGFSLNNNGTIALGATLADAEEGEKIGSFILNRFEQLASNKEKFAESVKKVKTEDETVEGFQLSSFVFTPRGIAVEESFPQSLADRTIYLHWGLRDDAIVLWAGLDSQSGNRLRAAIEAVQNPVANQGGSVKVSVRHLGFLLRNFQVDQIDPQSAFVIKALIESGNDGNVTLSQTVRQGSLDVTLTINGRALQVFSRIANDNEPAVHVPSNLIRELR